MSGQYKLHEYLFSLPSAPNYQLPTAGEFTNTICPHYGMEVHIYWLLAVMASLPQKPPHLEQTGTWTFVNLNWTLAFAYLFVYINLRTTAAGTREWYRQRFGDDAVKGKSLLITDGW